MTAPESRAQIATTLVFVAGVLLVMMQTRPGRC